MKIVIVIVVVVVYLLRCFYLSDERIYINEQHFTNIKLLQNILTEHIKSNEHKKRIRRIRIIKYQIVII